MKNRIDKNSQNLVWFNEVTKAEVLKEINYINNIIDTPFNTILSRILKISSKCSFITDYLSDFLYDYRKVSSTHTTCLNQIDQIVGD